MQCRQLHEFATRAEEVADTGVSPVLRWLANEKVKPLNNTDPRAFLGAKVLGTRLSDLVLHAEVPMARQGRCPSAVKNIHFDPKGAEGGVYKWGQG